MDSFGRDSQSFSYEGADARAETCVVSSALSSYSILFAIIGSAEPIGSIIFSLSEITNYQRYLDGEEPILELVNSESHPIYRIGANTVFVPLEKLPNSAVFAGMIQNAVDPKVVYYLGSTSPAQLSEDAPITQFIEYSNAPNMASHPPKAEDGGDAFKFFSFFDKRHVTCNVCSVVEPEGTIYPKLMKRMAEKLSAITPINSVEDVCREALQIAKSRMCELNN